MTQRRRVSPLVSAASLLFCLLLVAVVLSRADSVSTGTAKEIKDQNHRREDVGGMHMTLDSFPLDRNDETPLSGPWPECQGLPSETCVAIVEKGNPDLVGNVVVVHPGEGITRDYNVHRVIVYVDENDVVENVPNRG